MTERFKGAGHSVAMMRSTSQGTLNSGAAVTNTMSSGHALAGSGGGTSTYAFGANHPAVSAPGVSHPAASLPPSQPKPHSEFWCSREWSQCRSCG